MNRPDQPLLDEVNKAKGWLSGHSLWMKIVAAAVLLAVGFILGKLF